uniref:Myosin motor domain-containing protein n=1 Tax=Angiostrongylus cantonensis TaxID=6313 RepID=A0A0K0DQ55_ANGCA
LEAPLRRAPFHPSGVGKLVPDLSGRIAALARYIGRPPRVIVKARYAFNHLQRCLMKTWLKHTSLLLFAKRLRFCVKPLQNWSKGFPF